MRKVTRDPVEWPDDATRLSCPQWLLDREIFDNEYNAWEKAVRDGGTDLPPLEPEEPKYRQIIVDDMTMEALGQDVLADNPRGVLMVYDEMMALIRTSVSEIRCLAPSATGVVHAVR